MADTHTVMPKKLAQALMEAGMQHFDAGGVPQATTSSAPGFLDPIGAVQGQTGVLGGSNSFANQVAGFANPIGQLFGSTQNKFQAQAPGISQQNFIPGIANQEVQQQGIYNQQQSLANTLLNQSNGQGPGQALIGQENAQNAAQQAALMAGQRGASQNPALMARQAAQAGAAGNQQVAANQANLALQSQGALANQQSAMANQNIQEQGVLQGGQAAQNTAINQGSLGAQGINAQTSQANQSASNGLLGGVLGGVGSAVSSILNKGGEVKKMADGGAVDPYLQGAATDPIGGPVNNLMGIPSYGAGSMPTITPYQPGPNPFAPQQSGGGKGGGGIAGLAALLARGGGVPGQMLAGGNVPGKPKVKGDSEENDVVPTMLSPGEDVIPRSITQLPEKEMEKKAIEFLKHLRKKKSGYSDVIEARRKRG